jgi:hypothetical protein
MKVKIPDRHIVSMYFAIVKAITSASNQKKFLGLEDKLNNIELRIIRDCFSLEQSNEYDNYYIIKVNIKKIKFITDNNVDKVKGFEDLVDGEKWGAVRVIFVED